MTLRALDSDLKVCGIFHYRHRYCFTQVLTATGLQEQACLGCHTLTLIDLPRSLTNSLLSIFTGGVGDHSVVWEALMAVKDSGAPSRLESTLIMACAQPGKCWGFGMGVQLQVQVPLGLLGIHHPLRVPAPLNLLCRSLGLGAEIKRGNVEVDHTDVIFCLYNL